MRIYVMDLGSHTFRLLTADVQAGVLTRIQHASVTVRVVDSDDGTLAPLAIERAMEAIAQLLAPLGGIKPISIATGALRAAPDRGALIDEARRRFDLAILTLPTQLAAELTYRAVRAEVVDPDARIAIIDLGGGSLDCILGDRGRVELADSFPLGVIRLARRFVGRDMESRVERLVMSHAGATIEHLRGREPDEVVLTSGTARTLLRVARNLGRVEPVVSCLSTPAVVALASRLAMINPSETPVVGVPPERCDTIAVGAIVLATIVPRLAVPFVRVTHSSLLEGVALQIAARHGGTLQLPRVAQAARTSALHG